MGDSVPVEAIAALLEAAAAVAEVWVEAISLLDTVACSEALDDDVVLDPLPGKLIMRVDPSDWGASVFTAADTVELTALELLTTDCELKLTAEEETAEEETAEEETAEEETAEEEAAEEEAADEEAADEEITKLALLDWVLETADTDDELAACAGAAYKLTSVVSSSLAWTEDARITRNEDPSRSTTAIWTRVWPSITAEQVIPSSGSNEQVKGTELSLSPVLSKTL
jgi:hypothetical protein